MSTFKVGDRVRFIYPNAPWGAGEVIEVEEPNPLRRIANKTYTVRLDTPKAAYREGGWGLHSTAWADDGQVEAE